MYIHHKWPNSALKSPYTAYQSQIGLPPSTLTRKNRGSMHPFIYLSIYLSSYLSISSVYLTAYLAIYPSTHLSIYLSIYLSLSLSVCLSISLPVYLPAWKPSYCARLPHFSKLTTSKTQQFCGTSSFFELNNIQNEAILPDLFNFWIWQHQKQSNSARLPSRIESWVQRWRPRTIAFCDFSTPPV